MFSGQKCDVRLKFYTGREMTIKGVHGTPGQVSNMLMFGGANGGMANIDGYTIDMKNVSEFHVDGCNG